MTALAQADAYLSERTGTYQTRAVRYRLAARALGMSATDPLIDLGSGRRELHRCLSTEFGWVGNYQPIDAAEDGTDLERWSPPPAAAHRHYAALEVLEHLRGWEALLARIDAAGPHTLVVTVPDPAQVDVLGMDRTHVSLITRADLIWHGFDVQRVCLYGLHYGGYKTDALIGVRRRATTPPLGT